MSAVVYYRLMSSAFNEDRAGRCPSIPIVADLIATPHGFSVRPARTVDVAISFLSRLQLEQQSGVEYHGRESEALCTQGKIDALDALIQFTGDRTELVALRKEVDLAVLHAQYLDDRILQEKGNFDGDWPKSGRINALAWFFGDAEGF